MPTAAERHALLFLAAVAVIGGGVRTVSASRFAGQVNAAERRDGSGRESPQAAIGDRALDAQLAAIDSAQAVKAAAKRAPRGGRSKPAVKPDGSASAGPRSPAPPLVVDINRASAAELERLPRVGPALAQRIVAWREKNGPFRSLEDLRHVRGIGPATATLLAPAVTF